MQNALIDIFSRGKQLIEMPRLILFRVPILNDLYPY